MENERERLYGLINRICDTIRGYNKIMKENRHYELTDETIEFDGHTLHRIRCTEDFWDITKGTLGGFVEGYKNLRDHAWVADEAKVYNGAIVRDHAWVTDEAKVYNGAIVRDHAWVTDKAKVYNGAIVSQRARVSGMACVSNNAFIAERATVGDSASVRGWVSICGSAAIYDFAVIRQRNPQTLGISGWTKIGGDAVIESNYDYIVFKNWWSSGRYFTWTRSNDMWRVGCFYGTGKELVAKAYKDSKVSGREYKKVVKYVEQIKRNSKPSLWQRVKKMLTGK